MTVNNLSFQTGDKIQLNTKLWSAQKNTKAVIIIVHGLAEHINRYDHVGNFFSSYGYTVEGYDLRGHGNSDGKKAYMNSIFDHVSDLKNFVSHIKDKYPEKKVFILGHSMGGEIACLYSIKYQKETSGLILTGAVIKISDDISPLLQKLSGLIAAILPNLPTTKIDSSGISQDKKIVESYNNDPLVYRGGTLARTGSEIINGTKYINKNMKHIISPILILHGTLDRLADPNGSSMLYNRIMSKDKKIKLYENYYHEILNEPGKDKVMHDILDWITKRA